MSLVHVVDPYDPRLDSYLRLSDRQLRSVLDPGRARMICESRIVIDVALAQGLKPISLLIDERRLDAINAFVARIPPEVPIYVTSTEILSATVGFSVTRGIFGCFPRPTPVDPAQLLVGARRVAVLENIVDVTNVGAIFRSAAALGIDAVLLAPRCADPLTRRALRVSMGTILQVPWAFFGTPWPQGACDQLHEQGFCCAALAVEQQALPLDSPVLAAEERLALFFGTEGDGLSHEALAGCDRIVTIPMKHGVDSLNVAAASAVVFWELCR